MADNAPVKRTVVIVDDELDMRIFMSTLFETSGFQAVVARNGREGLAQVRQLNPDLILLDVMMPGDGGAWLYKALKEDPRLACIPVIMLSAVTESAFRHYLTMLNAQCDTPLPPPQAYMEKPPDPDHLLAVVGQVLG